MTANQNRKRARDEPDADVQSGGDQNGAAGATGGNGVKANDSTLPGATGNAANTAQANTTATVNGATNQKPADGAPAVNQAGGDVATQEPPARQVDTYLSRELRHIEREKAGELSVAYVKNDNTAENMKLLIGLTNVFSKCLPNMPKTYIVRLLFDRRHRSVVIVRNDGTVIGGIAYRPFQPQRFAEIAFCAIAQTLQVSGFGTRLMNWTKYYAREMDNVEYFLTYADNNAVGYFSKQGFTKTLSMPKDRWHGYIKDYDGGTLMECFIHPTLPFTSLPEMMNVHRETVNAEVQKHSRGHVVYGGINWWKDEATRGTAMNVIDIPGVRQAGFTETDLIVNTPSLRIVLHGKLVEATPENLKALFHWLIKQLLKEEQLIWPFKEPVDGNLVPDYYTIIKDPIDIKEIKRRLDHQEFYTTVEIFAADVQRMFSNAKLYNSADTPYYKAANRLSQLFSQWVTAAVHYD